MPRFGSGFRKKQTWIWIQNHADPDPDPHHCLFCSRFLFGVFFLLKPVGRIFSLSWTNPFCRCASITWPDSPPSPPSPGCCWWSWCSWPPSSWPATWDSRLGDFDTFNLFSAASHLGQEAVGPIAPGHLPAGSVSDFRLMVLVPLTLWLVSQVEVGL